MRVVALRAAFIAMTLLPPSLSAQSALFKGSVLSAENEVPLAHAEITLSDLHRTVASDSAGRFTVTRIPAGKHEVVVRLIGYDFYKADVTFRAAQTVEADFLLTSIATRLATVDVKARMTVADWRLQQFNDRKRGSPGKFLTTALFAKSDGRTLSSILLSHVAGVTTYCSGGRCILTSARGGGQCPVQVVWNGIRTYTGQPGQEPFDINNVVTTDILGVEYYMNMNTPEEYVGRASGCGTIVIWTRNG